jgi:hypothetical protein
MEDIKKNNTKKESNKVKKSEGDNQWVSTGLKNYPDNRERRDGPGGENVEKRSNDKL